MATSKTPWVIAGVFLLVTIVSDHPNGTTHDRPNGSTWKWPEWGLGHG
jgi:hypothetical protein